MNKLKKTLMFIDLCIQDAKYNLFVFKHRKRVNSYLKSPTSRRHFYESKTNVLLYETYMKNLLEIKEDIKKNVSLVLHKYYGNDYEKSDLIFDYYFGDKYIQKNEIINDFEKTMRGML